MAISFEEIKRCAHFEDLMLPKEDRDVAFKRLARLFHPDFHPKAIKQATEAFQHLQTLYRPQPKPIVKIGKWEIREPFARGDLANLYYTNNGAIFKIARSRADNDLMDREKFALAAIHKEASGYGVYIPKGIEYLTASGRRANIINPAEPGFISLEDILNRIPGKLDFRHVVWMISRLTSALGFIHRCDYIHGAIVPSHLLYNPANHEMRLVDWCYSSKVGSGPIPAVVKAYRYLYPPEILKKETPQVSSDIFMMGALINTMTPHIPREFHPLVEWCMVSSPLSRPLDAWEFQKTWKAAAERTFGKPTFFQLNVPVS